jgi:hypothetical protein
MYVIINIHFIIPLFLLTIKFNISLNSFHRRCGVPTTYPWAWWWQVLHERCTTLYPQTSQPGKPWLVKQKLPYFGIKVLETKHWKGAFRMRRSVDFWYFWISQSYVVGDVRYTVTIDFSYTFGIAHIEGATWPATYSNCSWTVSMQLFDSPCQWHWYPCSLCSQLVYRCFTASQLLCCLVHSSHNEGTVVLTMGTEMMWWWRWLSSNTWIIIYN